MSRPIVALGVAVIPVDESPQPQMRIYLASPYGFSAQWQRLLLPEFISALESLGLEVWEPFERNGQVDLAQPGWAYQVAQRDLQDVRMLMLYLPS